MNFEEYMTNKYGRLVVEYEGMVGELSGRDYDNMKDSYNAALLNLPTCESCEYWEVAPVVSIGLCVHPNLDTKHFTKKDFGCLYHSKIEQLREINEN